MGRYSALATITIVLVGLSGAAFAWFEVGSLGAFTSTGYGRLLLVKIAVVVVIGALGAYNHFRLVPALSRGKAKASLAQLRTTLTIEILALAVVVALTSVLVVVTPAGADSEGGVVEEIVTLGDAGSVQLTIAPAEAGFNQIHLYTFDPEGRPADIAGPSPSSSPSPPPSSAPSPRGDAAGPAHFQLNGTDLAVGGTWTIEVRARLDRFTEATGSVRCPLPAGPVNALRHGMIGAMARLARIAVVALGLVLVISAPATAGTAGPSDFRSEVTASSRLCLAWKPGSEEATPSSSSRRRQPRGHRRGLRGEPYLRFSPDGTVERNLLSTATYLDDDRRGRASPSRPRRRRPMPNGAGLEGWPRRAVRMARPPCGSMDAGLADVDHGERVPRESDPWRVPIVVDGAAAEVQGTLAYASP